MAKICECCGQATVKARKPKGKAGRFKGRWPCPVYEAHMSDGEIIRMSFWSHVDKPLDIARGRRLILSCTESPFSGADRIRHRMGTWERPTIRYGAVHVDGQTIVDPETIADVRIAA